MTHPQQQPQPGQGTNKRKPLWIVRGIVAVIVVAVIGVEIIVVMTLIAGGTGSQGPAAQVDDAPGGPLAPAPAGDEVVTITYEVSGDAERARNITYSADENLNLSQQNGVDLPWSTEVPFPGNFPLATLALTAQSADGAPGEITCRILRDDEVIAETTSSGPYVVVTCSES